MTESKKPAPWEKSTCRVPMWCAGVPAGHCGDEAYGHQLPKEYLYYTRPRPDWPYCFGHACYGHGGPAADEPRIFMDGYTPQGRTMWCAVMPDFQNLQESPAGFDGNPNVAVAKLRAAMQARP